MARRQDRRVKRRVARGQDREEKWNEANRRGEKRKKKIEESKE